MSPKQLVFYSCFALVLFAAPARAQNVRHFTFHYSFVVENVPAGHPVSVWIPLAHSDDYQQVKVLSRSSDLPLAQRQESSFGNEVLYGETSHAARPQYRFTIDYDVIRHERVVLVNGVPSAVAFKDGASNRELARDLQPNQLVPVSGVPAEIASKAAEGHSTELDTAHALYEYVLHNMRYDKSGTGWGRGDAIYACDVKRGNCTDFHSLFIAMARSQKIPARFEIGFPIPNAHAGKIDGYHCWSDFYVPNLGWVPVDISEAWKHPEKRDYFFGAHDVNRVQFTVGRDLRLNPAQSGPPLNYFIYPYVEVDGQKYPSIKQEFLFADVGSNSITKAPASGTFAQQ
jgi:transglutaminase-like putative cysteine protease